MSTSYSISELLSLFETLDFKKIKNIFKEILTKQLANKVRILVLSRNGSNQNAFTPFSDKELGTHMSRPRLLC